MRAPSVLLLLLLFASAIALFLFLGPITSGLVVALTAVLVALPTLLLYLLPAVVLRRVFPRLPLIICALASICAITAMGLGYNAYRAHETTTTDDITATDVTTGRQGPFLLVLQERIGGNLYGAGACDDFCLRMLLHENTTDFAKATVRDRQHLDSLGAMTFPAVTIQKADSCPGLSYSGNLVDSGAVYGTTETMRTIMAVNPEPRIAEMERKGHCLVKRNIPFSRFDTIVYVERSPEPAKGLFDNPLIQPATFRVIEVIQRNGSRFDTTFRKTTKFADRLVIPPMVESSDVPARILRSVLELTGWNRNWNWLNSQRTTQARLARRKAEYPSFPDIYTVVVEQLKLPLALEPTAATHVENRRVPDRAAQAMPKSAVFQALFGPAPQTRTSFTESEIEQYIRDLANTRSDWWVGISRLRAAQPEAETTIFRAIVATLGEQQLPANGRPGLNDPVTRLAGVVGSFPEETIRSARAQFDKLDFAPQVFGMAPQLSLAMGLLGKSSLPLMLSILDGYSQRFMSASSIPFEENFQYVSAFLGLCAIGPEPDEVLGRIDAMADADMLLLRPATSGILTIVALRRMGIDPHRYWKQFEQAGWVRRDFDVFAGIAYDRSDCLFWQGDESVGTLAARYPQLKGHLPIEHSPRAVTTNF